MKAIPAARNSIREKHEIVRTCPVCKICLKNLCDKLRAGRLPLFFEHWTMYPFRVLDSDGSRGTLRVFVVRGSFFNDRRGERPWAGTQSQESLLSVFGSIVRPRS